MHVQRTLLATAVLSAFASPSFAQFVQAVPQSAEQLLPSVVITASPFGNSAGDQILTPAKVLSGDALKNRLGATLGDTLSNELGVSSSSFGAGASRPIIRGLEGSRVKILENGMSVFDVSGLSNDHAVSADGPTTRQIEILRGPAALLYGSGAIGGLINVVNDRIPTTLAPVPTGEIEARYGSVDNAKTFSASGDAAYGRIGVHVDGSLRRANDYRIPDNATLGDNTSPSGRLPNSFAEQDSIGLGASLIERWGYIGASVSSFDSQYGIPTEEAARIDLSQRRYDIAAQFDNPLPVFESFRLNVGYSDYEHTELSADGVPQTDFKNRGLETRAELTHAPIAGFRGTLGFQADRTNFSALDAATGGVNTVPPTRSNTAAMFLVEERSFGSVRMNAGLRLESVERKPSGNRERTFDLGSYSLGGLWTFMPGYGFGATASIAQRAPTADELYSGGPHEATATFDIGNPDFAKETSRNLELTLQKTAGLVRWQANVFRNRVKNFVFGEISGATVDEDGNPGGDLRLRNFSQGEATIRGAEAEVTYNASGEGVSLRGFADHSRGTLEGAGSLPLQPAKRFGVDVNYRQGQWRGGASVLRASSQDRLATFETPTPGHTLLDANLSYTQKFGGNRVTWFALAKNLLNRDIRVSTSVLKDFAPAPGRNLIVGVRTNF
ncbi:MAG: TonB-dependent receptor [Pseudomonadota bacterium]